jgi:hypothetical protein
MHCIWAVAVNTIRQALRIKVAVVFMLLLVVLLPIMAASMTGDGTIKGRLQTFASYGLSLTSLLLCLLTIIVATFTLTDDIKNKQIYTVITKPIARFQFILGKLLGVLMLDIALLVLFSAIIYSITLYIPKYFNASEKDLSQLRNEFFTARAGLKPQQPDVTKEVLETYEKLEKSFQLPAGVADNKIAKRNYIRELTRRKELEKRAAVPGQELIWKFYNVKPIDPNEGLFVRYKYDVSVNPPDLSVFGRWIAGDDRQINYGQPSQTPIYPYDRKDLIRTFHEIQFPADCVADDGYLAIGFLNDPLNETVVIFPLEDGLEVLYKADTYAANFLRAVLLILLRLVFLAVLGLLTATFLSFPVAILLCLVVFFTGTISGFVIESFSALGEDVGGFYSYTVKPVIRLLPRFDKFNPTPFLVSARVLTWSLLAKVLGFMICIKSVLLLLIALFIFSCREIAKVII